MLLVSVIVFLTALAVGTYSVYSLLRHPPRLRPEFLRSYIRNILFYDLLICLGVFFNYSNTFIFNSLSSSSYFIYQVSIIIVLSLLKLIWLYYFIRMNRQVLNFGLSRIFYASYLIFSGLLIGLLLAGFMLIPAPFKNSITNTVNVFFESLILAIALASLILLVIHTHYNPHSSRKKPVYAYCAMYILILQVFVATFILSFFITRMHREVLTLIYSGNLILYNILPLVWIRRRGERVLGPAP